MPKMIESWQAEDGRLFTEERDCVQHECLITLFATVPGLRDRESVVIKNASEIATALKPLADLLVRKDSTEHYSRDAGGKILYEVEHNTAALNEGNGGCDCGALLAGNAGADHLKNCTIFHPSDKPRWDACHPAGDGQGRYEG